MEIIRWGGTERQAGSRKAQLFSSMRPHSPTGSGSTVPLPSIRAQTKHVALGEPAPKSLCGMRHEQQGFRHERGSTSCPKTPLAGRKANLPQAAEGLDHAEGFGLRFCFLPRWLLNVAAVRDAHKARASQCTLHLLDLIPVLAVYLSERCLPGQVNPACRAGFSSPTQQTVTSPFYLEQVCRVNPSPPFDKSPIAR